jgi:spore maturation protein CgeB
LPDSQLWRANLYQALVGLGHDVVPFEFDFSERNRHLDPELPLDAEFIANHRPAFSEELLKQVRAAHNDRPLDVFFSYFYSAYVEPEAISDIGRLGVVTMNWYCNASYQFRLVEEIAPRYDYSLVPERFRLADYARVGANPVYFQEAANPDVYRPYDVAQEFDVTFVGQRYGDRPAFVRRLLDDGIGVRVWGPRWQDPLVISRREALVAEAKRLIRRRPRDTLPASVVGPPLSDEDYILMYSRSRVSLGFSKVAVPQPDATYLKQVRLRDFEATIAGAFYLVESCDELAECFEPDREIVMFNDADELSEKAQWYLRHGSERDAIRAAGRARALADHTWQVRFMRLFESIGLAR